MDFRSRVLTGVRILLTVMLAGLGLGKLVGGYADGYWIPRVVFYSASLIEILVALLLWTRWAFCAAGMLIATAVLWHAAWWLTLWPLSGQCGCTGVWRIGPGGLLFLVSGVGLLSLLMIWCRRGAAVPTWS